MGRNKSTGGSHNKNLSTYKSKRTFKQKDKNQSTLFKFLKNARNVEESTQSEVDPSQEQQPMDTPDLGLNESEPSTHSDSEADSETNKAENAVEDSINQHASSVAHQIQEKWETAFEFATYLAKQRGWLCKICSEYGEGSK